MQKKLLSLAIAGALAVPGAAMADVSSNSDVTVYGKFHASYDFVDNGAADSDDSDDNTGTFRNSRIGFKGSEDLGGGLNAVWQVETGFDQEDNDFDLRNTYVGLESNGWKEGNGWGRIVFGKHDSPYKLATAFIDPFADTVADHNEIIGTNDAGTMFNARPSQLIAYSTPIVNGWSAMISRQSYQFDEEDAGIDEETESWSVMGQYDQGPFFASLAYENLSGEFADEAFGGEDEQMDAWKVGLGYTFGNSKVAFIYEDIDHDEDSMWGDALSRDAYSANFSHKFGANVFKLAYSKANDTDWGDDWDVDDGADSWSVGIDHNFSKRTKVYAVYTDLDNNDAGMYGLHGLQGNGDYSAVNPGDDLSSFSVGVTHSF